MPKTLAACLLILATSSSIAQALPDTTMMSCLAAKSLVKSSGAIVLATGPTTYDRYVVGEGFCTRDEVAKPAFVPSAGNPQCFIGYYCFPRESEEDR